eukprot:4491290-Amphidinium_carterae.1
MNDITFLSRGLLKFWHDVVTQCAQAPRNSAYKAFSPLSQSITLKKLVTVSGSDAKCPNLLKLHLLHEVPELTSIKATALTISAKESPRPVPLLATSPTHTHTNLAFYFLPAQGTLPMGI